MLYVIEFLLFFSSFYLIMYLFRIRKIKGWDKQKLDAELLYMYGVYKIDKAKVNCRKLMHILTIINALIISTTVIVISEFDLNVFYRILIGSAVAIGLILGCYHIIGLILKKKGMTNHVRSQKN